MGFGVGVALAALLAAVATSKGGKTAKLISCRPSCQAFCGQTARFKPFKVGKAGTHSDHLPANLVQQLSRDGNAGNCHDSEVGAESC